MKSPTKAPKPVLTEGTALRYTKVMELYDGLSINTKKNISVELSDHAPNVKLVKLKVSPAEENEDRDTSQTKVGNTSSSGTIGTEKSKPSKVMPSAPVKEGKRKRMKKMFASLFTGAPDETSADEENASEENKTVEDSDMEDNKTCVKLIDQPIVSHPINLGRDVSKQEHKGHHNIRHNFIVSL